MQQLVAQCLVKDPTKRPTAARLLENRFFKVSKSHVPLTVPCVLVDHLTGQLMAQPLYKPGLVFVAECC